MKNEILSQLSACYPWSDFLEFYDTIDSTNTRLKLLAQQGAPEGTVLIADRQTAGRGRIGRSFLSPPGVGLYMSILFRPDCKPSELMHLTCGAAVAACSAIEASCGFRPGIKWTNDLVYNRKKLAGILTELGFASDGHIDYAVIGIGINCCQESSDFAPEIAQMATSLSLCSEKNINRSAVAAAMLESFYSMRKSLLTGRHAIMDQYRSDCVTLGQQVQVIRQNCIREGRAICINEDGALVVEYSPSERETVSFGEVSVRGMYGYL